MSEKVIFQKMDGPGWVKHPRATDERGNRKRIFFPAGVPQVVDFRTNQVENGPALFGTSDPDWIELLREFPSLYKELSTEKQARAPFPEADREKLQIPGVGVAQINALREAGYNTLDKVFRAHDADLNAVRGVAQTTINTIRAVQRGEVDVEYDNPQID